MNKIKALYINEIIKISKKVSILILLIIMVAGVFGVGGLLKIQQNLMTRGGAPFERDQQWMIDEMKYQQEMLREERSQLEQTRADLDPETDLVQYRLVQEQIDRASDHIEMYQTAIDENILLFYGDSFLNQTLYKIIDMKYELRSLEQVPSAERDEQWQENFRLGQEYLSGYEDVVLTRDFSRYIAIESAKISRRSELSDSDREIELERLAMWYKLDPSGGLDSAVNSYGIQQTLSQFSSLRRSLESNLDYAAQGAVVPLTPERRSELENQLAVLTYKAENNLIESSYAYSLTGSAISSMYSFGAFMIVLMALILAGSAVSQEIATGSIKSLIISPAKRWKIFTAKVLSLVTVCGAAVLVLYVLGIFSNGIFFGFGTGNPYVYAVQGKAYEMGFALFNLASLGVRLIDILVFMSLALMLSVLTRNTAAAVGISMAAYFGNSIFQPIMMLLPQAEWVKFIPYININLLDRFFPFQDQMLSMDFAVFGLSLTKPDLAFSLVYLLVFCTCMLYTALDSFNRRDIK